MIFEQLSLKDILLTIDGVQSRVHLLQGRLSKARYEGRNLAFSEGVRVVKKRQHTQKRSSYTECRYTKPQKKKNLNVLLMDDNGPAFSGRPSLPDRETDTHIKDANRIAEERSGECNHSREKAITVDLLLGIGNSIPNCYIEDLCKEVSLWSFAYSYSFNYLVLVAMFGFGLMLAELLLKHWNLNPHMHNCTIGFDL